MALVVALIPLLPTIGAVVTTDRYIVPEGEVVTEDQYVTSSSVVIEGTIDGNLVVFSGDITITGLVTGTVTAFSAGSVVVAEGGSIAGSLNGAATSVSIIGTVGSDVFVAAGSTVVEDPGSVGRDLIGFGGTLRADGTVGRDVRGRAYRVTVSGTVRGDVDVATQSLGVGPTATIDGDILYRSTADAEIASGADIGGTVTKLPTQGNFVYSIVLSIANVVSFLGFIVAGIIALWLFRATGSRAVGSMLSRPFRSLLVGVAAVILIPLLVALLAVTLVGLPAAIAVGAGAVVLFVIGAVPAVTALGHLVLFRRGGLFGGFIVGAVIWRLSFFIPWVGPFLFLLALTWGIGAWTLGAIATRRAEPIHASLLPAAVVESQQNTEDWEPPLAPQHEVHLESAPAPTDDDMPEAGDVVDDSAPDESGEADERGEPDDDPSTIEADFSGDAATGDADEPPVEQEEEIDSTVVERERSIVDDRVTFDSEPEPDAPSEEVSADDDEPSPDSEPSLSERFQALREELLTTGTVDAPDRSADDDDDPPPKDWGLPGT